MHLKDFVRFNKTLIITIVLFILTTGIAFGIIYKEKTKNTRSDEKVLRKNSSITPSPEPTISNTASSTPLLTQTPQYQIKNLTDLTDLNFNLVAWKISNAQAQKLIIYDGNQTKTISNKFQQSNVYIVDKNTIAYEGSGSDNNFYLQDIQSGKLTKLFTIPLNTFISNITFFNNESFIYAINDYNVEFENKPSKSRVIFQDKNKTYELLNRNFIDKSPRSYMDPIVSKFSLSPLKDKLYFHYDYCEVSVKTCEGIKTLEIYNIKFTDNEKRLELIDIQKNVHSPMWFDNDSILISKNSNLHIYNLKNKEFKSLGIDKQFRNYSYNGKDTILLDGEELISYNLNTKEYKSFGSNILLRNWISPESFIVTNTSFCRECMEGPPLNYNELVKISIKDNKREIISNEGGVNIVTYYDNF